MAGLGALMAIGGGIALATGVDKLPPEWLKGTPFSSYLYPGIHLTVVVGGSAAAATLGIARRRPWGASASLVAGAIMMGWIVGEALILNQPSTPTPAEVIFFFSGVAMAVLGWMSRSSGRKSGRSWMNEAHQPLDRQAHRADSPDVARGRLCRGQGGLRHDDRVPRHHRAGRSSRVAAVALDVAWLGRRDRGQPRAVALKSLTCVGIVILRGALGRCATAPQRLSSPCTWCCSTGSRRIRDAFEPLSPPS